MFITLLGVTFLIAIAVSMAVGRFFATPVRRILSHIVAEDITFAWAKYIWFAILVVGISSGVRVWELERYITGYGPEPSPVLELTTDRWILEVYRTIIGTLQGVAWLLLVFFVVSLIAYVIVRVGESRMLRKSGIPDSE